MLRRVVYISIATKPMNRRELLDLLHDARGFNKIDGITGLLLHDCGQFLQVIEGPANAIDDLLARLKKDKRHGCLKIFEDTHVQERLFPAWSMGLGDLSDPALSFLPGIAVDSESEHQIQLLVGRIPELADQLHLAVQEAI